MMAEWDLPRLERDLPRLKVPLLLIVASNDRSINPSDAERVRTVLPQTTISPIPGLGHLAHEERPDLVGAIIVDAARAAGVLTEPG
jgi:magnesium chelatase accessory protein